MKKELCITSDFFDDLWFSGLVLKESHIEDMMQYAASLGATRFEWLYTTLWNMYDQDSPFGYDLLKVACEAAHRNGMRFDAVYKPFESGSIRSRYLPHSFPHASSDRVVVSDTGVLHCVRQFVVDHPQCRIARRKGDGQDPGGTLAEIRLVKAGESDIQISPEDISFWYSEINGNFRRYEGTLETSITREWKLYFPYNDSMSTVLSFKGFDLPQEVKYVEVRCEKCSDEGTFTNEINHMVELVNDKGEVIPCDPSTIKADPKKMYDQAKRIADLGITNYLNQPRVSELLTSFDIFNKHLQDSCSGMYVFVPQWEDFTLDRRGEGVIAVHRGKPMHHPSTLHPIYPEVRKNWLDEIQYCIDRGVDGVNIRISRHGGMNEPWAYGFNEPVMQQLQDPGDTYEAAIINGRAFDTFMQDAAKLLHDQGREIGVHLCGLILSAPDKKMVPPKPSVFHWNWEMWVRDLVDYTEFHKSNFFTFENTKRIINHFGHVVSETGKPLIYQSGQSGAVTHYDGPHRFLPMEMQWAKNHRHITCYNLYETANFFKINEDGQYQGSPEIKDLLKTHWS